MARTSQLEGNSPKGVRDTTILYLKVLRQTREVFGITDPASEPNLQDAKRSLVYKWLLVWKKIKELI